MRARTEGSKMGTKMEEKDEREIRLLLDDYLRMYASRDDRLTARFSDDFSGFTGGGDFLVKDREEWVSITRQDFAQVQEPIRIELKDVSLQSLSDTVAVATSFFAIHLPIEDQVLSRETARLVLIFRKESGDWKITHSSISIPYHLVREGEIYPLKELVDRNRKLEGLVVERTSQLREANDSLRRSNRKIEAIAAVSPDGIGIISPDGKIRFISDKLVRMHGYEVEEAVRYLGTPVLDFIDESSHRSLIENIGKALAGNVDGSLREYLAVRKDGSRFHIDVKSTVLRDADGNPTGILYVERDITERKQAEADREKLEIRSRQLQKAESLGRMAGAIAHTFNNQLGVVIGNLSLALKGIPEGSVQGDRLVAAMEAAKKAATVSGQMLAFLGLSFDKRGMLDLSEACREILADLRDAMPDNVTLTSDLPVPGPAVHANGSDIRQAVANLVANAWEAAGEGGGKIRVGVRSVSASAIPQAHRYPVDWQPEGNEYACLEVEDAGVGIPARDVEKLFDPFYSSKFTGRGLGLAVVLGIVKAHRGAITVESEPGRGSVFRIYLPRSAGDPLPPGNREA